MDLPFRSHWHFTLLYLFLLQEIILGDTLSACDYFKPKLELAVNLFPIFDNFTKSKEEIKKVSDHTAQLSTCFYLKL
jgi:hypothetical protein